MSNDLAPHPVCQEFSTTFSASDLHETCCVWQGRCRFFKLCSGCDDMTCFVSTHLWGIGPSWTIPSSRSLTEDPPMMFRPHHQLYPDSQFPILQETIVRLLSKHPIECLSLVTATPGFYFFQFFSCPRMTASNFG